jgi:ferredoxin
MKISIDHDRCQGHAMCHLVAPEVFDVDNEGYGVVLDAEILPHNEQAAVTAQSRCQENAVLLGG